MISWAVLPLSSSKAGTKKSSLKEEEHYIGKQIECGGSCWLEWLVTGSS